jgi:hypothetical protein
MSWEPPLNCIYHDGSCIANLSSPQNLLTFSKFCKLVGGFLYSYDDVNGMVEK